MVSSGTMKANLPGGGTHVSSSSGFLGHETAVHGFVSNRDLPSTSVFKCVQLMAVSLKCLGSFLDNS